MKSTSFFTAHSMKRRSFSVTDGRSIFIPGTLTLLRDRSVPPRTNSHISSSSVLSQVRKKSPSYISLKLSLLSLSSLPVLVMVCH